jgi:hypothetical protein
VGVATVDPQKTTALRAGQAPPPPVFVDTSGRRHRGLRRVAVAAGALALLALIAFWATQLLHPVEPASPAPCGTVSAGPTCGHR